MKMTTMKASFAALMVTSLIIFIVFLVGCSEIEQTGKTGTMTVKLTNAASMNKGEEEMNLRDLDLLTAINLDVQACEMHYTGDTLIPGGWVSLPTNPGIYNLLDLDTDATVILVDELTMPMGHVTQMRIILGPNNTIDIDGVIYPLKVPSGEQSGLKILINEPILFVSYIEVLLDFDPYHSVVEQGNGGYILKPVIKVTVINQV